MDVAGARALSDRLRHTQQLHWREAAAVRDGSQEAVDPDADQLVAREDTTRHYQGPAGRFRKVLLDGRWHTVDHSNEARPASGQDSTRVGGTAAA